MAKYELRRYGECDPGLEEMANLSLAQAQSVLTLLEKRRALLAAPDALAAQERNSLTEITARILNK